MEAVSILWPGETKFVHGRPGHSQSQGLVEQGNHTIQVMISARERDRNECSWSMWLSEIQCKYVVYNDLLLKNIQVKHILNYFNMMQMLVFE